MKLYERHFAEVSYQQEIFNGLSLFSDLSYNRRKALYNTTDQVWRNVDDINYTSNDPLQPFIEESAPYEDHNIYKFNLNARIDFAQNYMSYPDGKFNIGNNKYPTLFLGYEKGFGASVSNYDFDQLKISVRQDLNLGNKGAFTYNLRSGTFLNGENIAFLDYQHFNGNQTRVGDGFYSDRFLRLPYYDFSTNKSYLEGHLEHDFKGWVLGKIPGINQLNFNLVLGAHFLSTENNKPYTELSAGIDNLGFGKFRFLRLDYVISNYEGNRDGAFIFGLKFLRIFD